MTSSMVFRSESELVAFRLGSARHTLLDGTGAATSDLARWNSRGRYVIYAAEHYSTAVLEKAAQVMTVRLPRSLVYIRIGVPEGVSIEEVRSEDLPGWDVEEPRASQHFGDRWYDERRSLVLLVPSRTAPGLERNVLINQQHPEFTRVTATTASRILCHPKLLV
jgi:RES domain-containing protein